MGTSFDRNFQDDEQECAKETPSDNQECKIDPEKAGRPLDLDPAALPPCSPKNIRDGKACILQRKPYLKIYFPGHKTPAKQPEDVEWGREEKNPKRPQMKLSGGEEMNDTTAKHLGALTILAAPWCPDLPRYPQLVPNGVLQPGL